MKQNSELFNQIAELEKEIAFSSGKHEAVSSELSLKKKAIDEDTKMVEDMEIAMQFLALTAKNARNKTIESIETVASNVIQHVWEKPIKIKAKYNDKKKVDSNDKMTLVAITETKSGEIIETPLTTNNNSGGLCETASLALMLASIQWMGYNGIVVFDESAGKLSNDHKIEGVADVFMDMQNMIGNQMIFSTHKEDVFGPIASKRFHFTKDEDTEITRVEVI
jgi:hypothetical protein